VTEAAREGEMGKLSRRGIEEARGGISLLLGGWEGDTAGGGDEGGAERESEGGVREG